jgi:hypothetical protein
MPRHDPPVGRAVGACWASLSGGNAGSTVLGDGTIKVAQSGEEQFAFLRTEESVLPVDQAKAHELGNACIFQLVTMQGMTVPAATRQMARETAAKLKLVYYEGRNGVLTKVGGP